MSEGEISILQSLLSMDVLDYALIMFNKRAVSNDYIVWKQNWILKSEAKKTGHTQKLAINKKSTIFVLSLWNLAKIITSWGNHFHQVSWG